MPKSSTLGKIEKEIERLSPKDQLKLVEKLTHPLRKSGITIKKDLDWKGEDAQEYVKRLREERV
jgi:hypothetical protein